MAVLLDVAEVYIKIDRGKKVMALIYIVEDDENIRRLRQLH